MFVRPTTVGLGFLFGLPLLGLGACSDDATSRPDPSVAVTTGGADEMGQGGDAPMPVLPEGGNGPVALMNPCNGWPQLCQRAYDRVTFPVTHAAMANSATFWKHPAQSQSVRTQLDGSIRGLMLEVHDKAGVPTLCFDDCADGALPLVNELKRVAAFLGDNPREVVTLLIDNRVPASDLAQAFDDAELSAYLYQGSGKWPTLGEMIERGERLVAFLSDATDAAAGFRSLNDEVRATSDRAGAARELDCATPSGSADAPFVLLLQSLVETSEVPLEGAAGAGGASTTTVGWPTPELAATVNRDPFFSERVAFCSDLWGKPPSFVAVDFYEDSDVIGVAQRASGLIP